MAAIGAAHGPALVWHVESLGGKDVDSRVPDDPINPASVVKLVTSLRALSTLGPDHRFETRFGASTPRPPRDGVLDGDLIVGGGGDPDFHFENAVLVSRRLLAAGVREIRGNLLVDNSFWIGWERGSAGRESDPNKRALQMADRLRTAWDPQRWSSAESEAWAGMAARYGWALQAPPRVRVDGAALVSPTAAHRWLVVHRSEPLLTALHRFNVFSNNDIERLDQALGAPSGMGDFLARRWGQTSVVASFETSSGLGRNRITPRMIVRVLRDLRDMLAARGRSVGDLLPVMGCGESTLFELFPALRNSGVANGMAGKTGTLNTTDGGVAALAGFFPTAAGETLFVVAAPHAGPNLRAARAAEEDWVARLASRVGGSSGRVCPGPVPTSDAEADAVAAESR
ncbi:MAG: D-alanyl-D-alanine carboxypeptidase [Deltaproteobacteria bacterium]|nr:D-alanyl-D-alanine carboxypeptidase [Deltaproteobacteria bacterium]